MSPEPASITRSESHLFASPIGPVEVLIDPITLDLWSCLPASDRHNEETPLYDDLQDALSHCTPLPKRYTLHQESPSWAPRFWEILRQIRRGETLTYGELCRLNALPGGYARAVGRLLSQNRYMILLPCHRVVPADFSIGGYRWGVEQKRRLLDYERGMSHH
ncbi:MGMT family protein [uncultured Porphyromonas sp.]|uniref:MGMT family protein n=1 Tax=uncultured Porphyromonas sp. TaxID=159274 RepID=UPI002602FAF5|nr:MGMT family protein [uncultured Porphyromonas sp.]